MWARTTSPRGSSGGGSSRSTAVLSVRHATVRMETSRKATGNGGTSGASHGKEKGPEPVPASTRGWPAKGAPRQGLSIGEPGDGVPVPDEPEPGLIGQHGAAVANLQGLVEQRFQGI